MGGVAGAGVGLNCIPVRRALDSVHTSSVVLTFGGGGGGGGASGHYRQVSVAWRN